MATKKGYLKVLPDHKKRELVEIDSGYLAIVAIRINHLLFKCNQPIVKIADCLLEVV